MLMQWSSRFTSAKRGIAPACTMEKTAGDERVTGHDDLVARTIPSAASETCNAAVPVATLMRICCPATGKFLLELHPALPVQ